MTQKLKIIVLFCLISLTYTSQQLLYAQCDKQLRPDKTDNMGYRIRSNNRCEGFYEQPVSSGTLDIVSVTQGKFKYNLDSDEIITVSPIEKDNPIEIRAVGIPEKTYYRMDANILPNKNLKWPVRDVLYPKKLGYKKIGVFGWIAHKREKIYVPLKITSKMILGYNNNRDLYIYLRAFVDVMNVRWRFSNLSSENYCLKAGKWIKTTKRVFNAGEKILCKISSEIKGPICIKVIADAMYHDEVLVCKAKIYMK